MPIRLPGGNLKKLEFREKLGAGDTNLGAISVEMVFISMIFKTMRPIR